MLTNGLHAGASEGLAVASAAQRRAKCVDADHTAQRFRELYEGLAAAR